MTKKSEQKTRLESIIEMDRASILAQKELDSMGEEVATTEEKWDYGLFRRIVMEGKEKVQNWFHYL